MSYLYVLVRRDLPPTQIAVQASHAAIEAARLLLPADSDHPHLVLCGVRSADRLLAAADFLYLNQVPHAVFREPDRGGEPTALAAGPVTGDRRRLFARFRCLTVADLVPDPGAA